MELTLLVMVWSTCFHDVLVDQNQVANPRAATTTEEARAATLRAIFKILCVLKLIDYYCLPCWGGEMVVNPLRGEWLTGQPFENCSFQFEASDWSVALRGLGAENARQAI